MLGSSCGLGQLNLLNGGVLNVIRVVSGDSAIYNGDSQFNFDGGTLRAATTTVTFMEGLTNASVKNGGAIIDSAGFNITIAQPLLDGGELAQPATANIQTRGQDRIPWSMIPNRWRPAVRARFIARLPCP